MESYELQPIGWMRCDYASRYETPRQPDRAEAALGVIELREGLNLEQALVGLEGFSHIWVIFSFHQNPRPERPVVMIQPPRHRGKLGVFATRSPHRPNGIGLSCLKLEKIEGRQLTVCGFDLLDGTPILDIKPYVALYDALPEAAMGWIPQDRPAFTVALSPRAQDQCQWICEREATRLDRYARVQLREAPLDEGRKRITKASEERGILAYRQWRIGYQVEVQSLAVEIEEIWPVDGDSSVARDFWAAFSAGEGAGPRGGKSG